MIRINEINCHANHKCAAVRTCPYGALTQEDVFSTPSIDYDQCRNCGRCLYVSSVFYEEKEELVCY